MTMPALSRQLTPIENYTLQVIGDERNEADLWSALPEHIRPERFKRTMVNLFLQKPEMLQYDPRAVFREVSKAAALGLVLDPQLGEAYIVPTWNNSTKRKEPELRCGYRGIMKLARQTKEIANLYPGEVCENDHFVSEEGTDKRLEHRVDYRKPRGRPYAYYAVVIYKDDTKDFDVMDVESLHRIRDRSDAWLAFRAGKIKSTPWATDEPEMCKKTVLKRLLKRVPQSPELSDVMAMEAAADFAPNATRLLPQQQIHQLRVIETPVAEQAEQPSDIPDDFAEDADFTPDDAPVLVSREQANRLIALADEVGADKVKFCRWLEVSVIPEILASQYDKAVRALEAKRRQTEQSPSAPVPPSVAETPAMPPAGNPPVSAPPPTDTGGDIDPTEEAYADGRTACESGVDFKDIPQKFQDNCHWRKAWKDGFQAQAQEMGA